MGGAGIPRLRSCSCRDARSSPDTFTCTQRGHSPTVPTWLLGLFQRGSAQPGLVSVTPPPCPLQW